MKKIICILCTMLLIFGSVAQAANYRYFMAGTIQDGVTIDGNSVTKLGQTYYATDQYGYLYKTRIFSQWIPVTSAPAGCKLISNRRPDADRIFVYVPGTLYVTYDGEIFHNIESFAQDAVVRYTCGLYTALQKADTGFLFRYSFDGEIWFDFPKLLTNPSLWVMRVNEENIILNDLATVDGMCQVVLSKSAPESCLYYSGLVYEFANDALIDNPAYDGAELVYADKTSKNHFLYVYRTDLGATYKYEIVRIYENRTLKNASAVIAGKTLELYIENDTLCFAQNNSSVNLINNGNEVWHQVSDDIAFPLLRSAHSLTQDQFFDAGYTNNYYVRNNVASNIFTDGVEVNWRGCFLAFDSAPQIINDRTMVPLRAIGEALGCVISYNAQTQQIQLDKDGFTLYMTIGSNVAYKYWGDGTIAKIDLDAAPVIVKNRTLVPLRFVSENLNIPLSWDSATLTVNMK